LGSAEGFLKQAKQELECGVSILSFPEGSRSADGELTAFHSGSARIALAAGAPLVPIGVIGTREIMPKSSRGYALTGHVHIHIGEPIKVDKADTRSPRKLTRLLKEGVAQAKAEARRLELTPNKASG
ncbi:1-acyl-sn-glycerol-3-phosphate acyltransferase, partial [Myxococcota bacterium]|nr:1-acyl-sn-glycerol-3-phosphate acyltransferase [Myxococcota bacterium]